MTSSAGCAFTTIWDAVAHADNFGGPDATIYAQAGTYNEVLASIWADDKVLRPGNISCDNVGAGTLDIVSSVPMSDPLMNVTVGASLTIYDSRISGGAPDPSTPGGNISVLSGGALTLVDVEVADGTTDSADGGCIAATDAILTFTNVTFEDCTAGSSGRGGAIATDDGSVLTWTGGSATVGINASGSGGAIFADESTLTLSDVDLTATSSSVGGGSGGGISLVASSADLTDVAIVGCSAPLDGGGVALLSSDLILNEGTVIATNGATDGGGVSLRTGGAITSSLVMNGDATIDSNTATNGGGIFADAPAGDPMITIDAVDEAVVSNNTAIFGGGLFLRSEDRGAMAEFSDSSRISGNIAAITAFGVAHGGGAYLEDVARLGLWDDVEVFDNFAETWGGAFFLTNTTMNAQLPKLDADGSTVIAPTVGTDTDGGVRIYENEAGDSGSAIFGDDAGISLQRTVVEGHAGQAVDLRDGSDLTASLSYFNDNEDVFLLADSTLTVQTDWSDAGCDVLLVPADFYADRYCTEISGNTGMIFDATGPSDGLFLAVAMMRNDVPTGEVAIRVQDQVLFRTTTCIAGHNDPAGAVDPVFVLVEDGGTFESKQSSFGNEGYPIRYENLSLGDFRRNAAWDPGVGALAVEVDAGALVTSTCNLGDWTAATLNGFNATDPLWVTTSRGDFHLDITSPLIDLCSPDGAFDIEGNGRPDDVAWEGGAIEFDY